MTDPNAADPILIIIHILITLPLKISFSSSCILDCIEIPIVVAKKPKIKIKNNEIKKLFACPIDKTTRGIAKATKRVLFEIFVLEVSAFPRAFAKEEKSAPAPADAVINPTPDGPWLNAPSDIKGKVSKTPLPTKAVSPLRTIENLITELEKISFIPSKKSKIRDLFLSSETKSLGLINMIKTIPGK